MARKKPSSGNWLKEHHGDPYVQRARSEGYRSRASYKLLDIQARDALIRPGMTVVDLGASPGGWSQVAASLVAAGLAGNGGRVVACDVLPMDALEGVVFIRGDFCEDEVFRRLLDATGEAAADLVMSDMAPNMSGMNAVDQPRSMHLAELALDLARRVLRPGGSFLSKVFQGEGFDDLLRDARGDFAKVLTRKPAASRPRSREVYLLARGFLGGPDKKS